MESNVDNSRASGAILGCATRTRIRVSRAAEVVRLLSQLGNDCVRVRKTWCNPAEERGRMPVGDITALAQMLKEQGTDTLTQ